jgi:hypothetical protein
MCVATLLGGQAAFAGENWAGWKLGGKHTMTAKVVVSKDNKTLTVTQTPSGARG